MKPRNPPRPKSRRGGRPSDARPAPKPRRRPPAPPSKPAGPERIQKVLAAAGYGSRRSCEELVLDGRVTVNGKRLTELPILVVPQADDIRVDGQPIRKQRHVYFMLNKPRGVLTTSNDPGGRRLAIDLLPGVKERVFSVGRLDAEDTGLLLMTNDGDLAERLTHPRYGVEKTYDAEVAGRLTPEDIEKLHRGMWMDGGRTQPARIRIMHRGPRLTHLHITLREGRNREVRRVLARLGHNVRRLKRIRLGPLLLRGVGVGKYRPLSPIEIETLQRAGANESAPTSAPSRARFQGRTDRPSTTNARQNRRGRRMSPPPA